MVEEQVRKSRSHRGPEVFRVPVPHGRAFYLLRVPKRYAPKKTAELAVRCAPNVLTKLPLPMKGYAFVPRKYPLLTAGNLLLGLLRLAALAPQRLSLCLDDPEGALAGRIEPFLSFAADVRVHTNRPERFVPDVETALRRYGAGLTVSGEDALLACDIALLSPVHPTAHASLCVSCIPEDGAFAPQTLYLPEPYAALCPDSVEPALFAAALFECCGVQTLGGCSFEAVQSGGRTLTLRQAADQWRSEKREITLEGTA